MDSNDLRSSDDICYVDLLVALMWLGRTRGYCVEFVSVSNDRFMVSWDEPLDGPFCSNGFLVSQKGG